MEVLRLVTRPAKGAPIATKRKELQSQKMVPNQLTGSAYHTNILHRWTATMYTPSNTRPVHPLITQSYRHLSYTH